MALPMDWNIPAAIRSRFGERLGRQRAMEADGHLVLVLHKAPMSNDPARHAVAYWRDPQGSWSCSAGGEGLPKLTAHVAEFEKRIDQIEADYDVADGADGWFGVLQNVVPVHRATSNLLATLQSAREACDDRDLITLRDRAGDAERAIDLLHHDVKNALDYAVARQAEEQARLTYQLARAGHRLTMLAAIFFPLTALSSAFGMNLRSGLERDSPVIFWGVVVFSILLGTVIYGSMVAPRRPRVPGTRAPGLSKRKNATGHHRTKLSRPAPPRP